MKTLSIILKNEIPFEFYFTNKEAQKIILSELVSTDSKTFDISRCVISINDTEVNFMKGDWTNPGVFYVNGLAGKSIAKIIEPFSVVKFLLKLNCTESEQKKLEDTNFNLHLELESPIEILNHSESKAS